MTRILLYEQKKYIYIKCDANNSRIFSKFVILAVLTKFIEKLWEAFLPLQNFFRKLSKYFWNYCRIFVNSFNVSPVFSETFSLFSHDLSKYLQQLHRKCHKFFLKLHHIFPTSSRKLRETFVEVFQRFLWNFPVHKFIRLLNVIQDSLTLIFL